MMKNSSLKFPLKYTDGAFETCDKDEEIRQSLLLLLNTRRGERLMRPNYGCDLEQFAFETVNFDLLTRIENEVLQSISRSEPRISDVKVSIESSDEHIINTETLVLNISYRIRENSHEQSLSINLGEDK